MAVSCQEISNNRRGKTWWINRAKARPTRPRPPISARVDSTKQPWDEEAGARGGDQGLHLYESLQKPVETISFYNNRIGKQCANHAKFTTASSKNEPMQAGECQSDLSSKDSAESFPYCQEKHPLKSGDGLRFFRSTKIEIKGTH